VRKEFFGKTSSNNIVELYILENSNKMRVKIINYGAIVVSLEVPDKDGKIQDIVLGYDKLRDYIEDKSYFGATIGRYGNRIANGNFSLEGKEYQLALNNGKNNLHGGIKGFNKVIWKTEPIEKENITGLKLTYLSPDTEEGFPGNLRTTVTYLLTENNELKISYTATTDKTTIINLTHHSYFNLSGHGNSSILNHKLMINANKFTPVNQGLIPTGELKNVENSPMDFRSPTLIGAWINDTYEQLKFTNGYDHNWILNKNKNQLELAAHLYDEKSGRLMEVYTTEPGIQCYTGNFLDGVNIGKNQKVYQKHSGVCLETQHYPDSPNKPDFPTTILKPEDEYNSQTVYKFSIK